MRQQSWQWTRALTNNRFIHMKFFAGENVARPIVQWLRQGEHDVRYTAKPHQTEDAVWLHEAEQSERLSVTADKDFGNLIAVIA